MTIYEPHPAAELFPMMDRPGLIELAEDIAKHGLLQPVVLHENRVLDGRNRVTACEMAGVTPRYVRWEQDGMTPTEWVIAANLHRRHLTTGQRAAIAVEALPLLEAEAKERVKRAGIGNLPNHREPSSKEDASQSKGRSTEIAAAQVGVGRATVERAKRLKQEAPEVFEQLKTGEVTVTAGLKEIDASPSNWRRPAGQPRPDTSKRMPVPPPKRLAPPSDICSKVVGQTRGFSGLPIPSAPAAARIYEESPDEWQLAVTHGRRLYEALDKAASPTIWSTAAFIIARSDPEAAATFLDEVREGSGKPGTATRVLADWFRRRPAAATRTGDDREPLEIIIRAYNGWKAGKSFAFPRQRGFALSRPR